MPRETNIMTLDGGKVLFEVPTDIGPEDFEDLAYWVDGVMKRLKRRAASMDRPISGEPSDEQ